MEPTLWMSKVTSKSGPIASAQSDSTILFEQNIHGIVVAGLPTRCRTTFILYCILTIYLCFGDVSVTQIKIGVDEKVDISQHSIVDRTDQILQVLSSQDRFPIVGTFARYVNLGHRCMLAVKYCGLHHLCSKSRFFSSKTQTGDFQPMPIANFAYRWDR